MTEIGKLVPWKTESNAKQFTIAVQSSSFKIANGVCFIKFSRVQCNLQDLVRHNLNSVGEGCFYTCLSFCSRGWGCVWSDRVPTRTGKPGKMGRHFPVREKSGNCDQTGKVRENHTKYWKTEGISDKYYMLFSSDS